MTSFAVSGNMSFPDFSLPNFHVQAEEAREISGAEVVLFAPLVRPDPVRVFGIDCTVWSSFSFKCSPVDSRINGHWFGDVVHSDDANW